MKIDWKRKLTSRKLWVAIASLATNIILALGGTESTAVQVTAIIMGGAAVLAYILGEGLVDAADKNNAPEVYNTSAVGFDTVLPSDNYGDEK